MNEGELFEYSVTIEGPCGGRITRRCGSSLHDALYDALDSHCDDDEIESGIRALYMWIDFSLEQWKQDRVEQSKLVDIEKLHGHLQEWLATTHAGVDDLRIRETINSLSNPPDGHQPCS